MVAIKGWQKTSLIDYSPYTASVIFTGGCSFRCGYCHNPDLVLRFSAIPDIKEKEILDYLKSKKIWIEGVVITGGEPTIHKDLPDLIKKIKKLGMKVRLFTNGTNPDMIEFLIKNKLLDDIAMDIKTDIDHYEEVACVKVDKEKIKKSIELIKSSNIKYAFLTTVIPGIVGKKQIFLISKMLKGSRKYVIQNFRSSLPLVNKKLQDRKPYSKEELEEMKEIASDYFDEVKVME